MKRAVLALRAFGAVQGASALLSVGLATWESRVERRLESTSYEPGKVDEILSEFRRITSVWRVGHAVTLFASLACVALLLASLPKDRGRAIAAAALGAVVVWVGLFVRGWLAQGESGPPSTTAKLLWIGTDVIADTALVLPVAAASRAAAGRGGGWVGGLAALGVAEIGVVAYGNFAKEIPHAFRIVVTALDVGLSLAVALAGWLLARHLAGADGPARASVGERGDGTPMRTLGWALLVRVGVGVVTTIGAVASLASKDYSTAGVAFSLGAMGSIVTSIVAVVGLTGYLRMPAERRSTEAITFALVAIVVSAVLDVWSASVAVELFDMVEKATKATSFWGMPSLSKMEEMQATLTWVGRGATVLGLVSTLVLLSSLRKTARFLGEKALDERGGGVLVLIVAVAACAIGASIAVAEESSGAMLLVGPIALLLAIALLVRWMQLLFGLADAIDRKQTAQPA